jgi:ADP-heptose:LPS heptosyltransferase
MNPIEKVRAIIYINDLKSFSNILVIRTDRIGDVILTLPLIDILKQRFPDSNIDFLVSKRVSELVSDYPNINKVHSIEKEGLTDILRICEEGKYELAVVVRPLFLIALAVYLSGIKYRLGTGYRWYSFLFNLRHYQHRKDSIKHELEYNVDLLRELGILVNEYPAPKIWVSEDALNAVWKRIGDRRFIVVHPTTLGSALAWRRENFDELIRLLRADKEFDYDIVVTGTEGEYTLPELAALISLASLFVSNSTGPIHIAAAVGTFAVGIYSPRRTESPARWAPYTDKKKIFVPDVPGTATGTGGEHSNVMDSIKPVEVYRFIKSHFSRK